VLVVQGDPLNRSQIPTVVCVPLTSNLTWKDAPGNVMLRRAESRLAKDSVANVSQIIAVDRNLMSEHVSRIPGRLLEAVLDGIDVILDR
jgi:mRNA interferase MazF